MSKKRAARSVSKIPQKKIASIVKTQFEAEVYKGPLPHPDHLKQYEELYPGASKQIFTMFENQSNHRMSIETSVTASNIRGERFGQICGFIITMTAIISGFILILLGKNPQGLAIILTSLGTVLGAFVIGKTISKKQLKNKE